MDHDFDTLQQRWHALRSQADLIGRCPETDANGRLHEVLNWLYERLDQIELELGEFAARGVGEARPPRDPPRNSAA